MAAALEDIKVVDITRTLAGPFCTMLLGDMGADVVKIEEPSQGDETRNWTPFWNNESTQFLTFNRNKRSITVNLKEPEGVELVRHMAADADVMIESFRAGALDRMGLGYDDISRLNPGIVYCSISGYGRTGPMADMPGYDLIIQAYSGLMHLTGEPDGMPLRVGFSLVDLFAGMMAYGTVVTALRQRDRTGKGQWVEASLLDGQVAALSYHATRYLGTGEEPQRMGSGHPSLVPYQSFASSDGYFILGCANQGLWERMCRVIGRTDLLENPRFATNTDRVAHREECVGILSEVFRHKTTRHWVELINGGGVPVGPINRVSGSGRQPANTGPQYDRRNGASQRPQPENPQLAIEAQRLPSLHPPPPAPAGPAQRRGAGGTGLYPGADRGLASEGVIGDVI